MLDLNIYPYDPTCAKNDPFIPGLYTGLPPRRAARGREDDRLVLYLVMGGSSTLSAEMQKEFLEKVTTVFYNTKGTVTMALRTLVSQLNDRLLARNLRGGKETTAVFGQFQAMVQHGNTVYFAQSGPMHAYVIGKEGVQHFYDPDGGGLGLGTSRTANVRFYFTDVKPGDRILFCTKPAAHWTVKNLTGSLAAGVDRFLRWLMGQTPGESRFLLLQAERGKGRLNLVSLEQALQLQTETPVESPVRLDRDAAPAAEKPAAVYLSGEKAAADESDKPTPIGDSGDKVAGLFAGLLKGGKKEDLKADKEETSALEATQPIEEIPAEFESPTVVSQPEGQKPTAADNLEPWSPTRGEPDFSAHPVEPAVPAAGGQLTLQRRQAARETRRAVSGGLQGWRAFKARATAGLNKILTRILPGQAEHLPSVSVGTLIFVAVAVPLIVVAVATTVYIQNGRGEQYKMFLEQSNEAFTQGQSQTDAVLRRVNFEAALEYITRAEEYNTSDESQALKDQIRSAIDNLDGISRFELRHALPADFEQGVVISQIWAAQTEDLYLLDSTNGRVLRMVYTRPGYELDSQFTCGPGMIGSLIIGPLVDIVLAPTGNNFGAVVLGVDASGNLLYCSLDTTKTTATTLPPPDAGWGSVKAITYQNNVLSILDVGGNAVWRFEGFGLDFSNPPRLFFDNQVPDLSGAIDLAVYMDDLFILNQDGHMILCTYSFVDTTPTRCTDPYPYRVGVSGQDAQELVKMDAQFTQMQGTQPPEPSLYFLDTAGRSVQQFSMSLNFVRRLQPRTDGEDSVPDTAPTGFAVTSGRNLVVAYENQVFIAALPAP